MIATNLPRLMKNYRAAKFLTDSTGIHIDKSGDVDLANACQIRNDFGMAAGTVN